MPRFATVALAIFAVGCVEQSPDLPTEDDIRAAKEHILSAAPEPKYAVNAELEDKLTYLGLDIDTETVTPGKAFTLTHYWKVNKPLGDDWRIFIHLEAPGTKKSHLNADHVPIGGKYPVHIWKAGEIIRDIHRVSVPQSWSADAVEIYVGAWKGPLRLKVTKGPKDNENRVFAVKLPTEAAAPPERKKVVAQKVKNGAVKLDGKLDEKVWKNAPSTGAFVRTLDGGPVDEKTSAKLLWDDKNLYIAFEVEDKDVWTTLDKHDDKLWTQEAVEVFIDADGDGKSYIEVQANPKGTTFDSYLPSYRQNNNDWESNVKVAVKVDGTVDNRSDKDTGWVVEMAIPLEAAKGLEKDVKNVPPKVGTEWRVNLYRLDSPAGRGQVAMGWSPPLVGDFHALDKFGVLIFGNEKGEAPQVAKEERPAKPEPAKKAEAPQPAEKPEQKAEAPAPAAKSALPFTMKKEFKSMQNLGN